jgi:hypothetical protein
LLIKCMTFVLLGLLGRRWVVAYMTADLSLYLVIKVMRGDFHYWLPTGGVYSDFLTSVFSRCLVKIVVDFTSIVQFRHPNEVGGMYWSLSLFSTLISLPISVTVYEKIRGDENVSNLAWYVIYSIIPTTLFFLALFVKNIDRNYLGTFFSLQRGKDLTIKCFRTSTLDSAKAHYSFAVTKKHWEEIEEEVRGWVEANWSKWEEEKPKWLDANMRMKIPVNYIPSAEARKKEALNRILTLNQLKRGNTREARKGRISPIKAEELVGGSLRSLSNLSRKV